jgi:hypothetical protein
MLGHRLPRHVEAPAQLAKRLAVLGMQPIQQLPATGIGQRLEDGIHRWI